MLLRPVLMGEEMPNTSINDVKLVTKLKVAQFVSFKSTSFILWQLQLLSCYEPRKDFLLANEHILTDVLQDFTIQRILGRSSW